MVSTVVAPPVEYTTTAVLVTVVSDVGETTSIAEVVTDVVIGEAEVSVEDETGAGVEYEVLEGVVKEDVVDATNAEELDEETVATEEDTLEVVTDPSDEELELEATAQTTLRPNCTPSSMHTVLRSAAAAVKTLAMHRSIGAFHILC